MTDLFEKLDQGRGGIALYGIAPPKLGSEPSRLQEIAAQQVARLRLLAPDGLVVYDIQDEPGANGAERPFPFLPTLDPEGYALGALGELALPKIVYRCVGAQPRADFETWLHAVRDAGERRLGVFVGAARGRSRSAQLPLTEAYELASAVPQLTLGGIAIAERHVSKGDEHRRILDKQQRGCRFFITQTVFDASSSKSLLSDYALALQAEERAPAPLVLTFSPCGSPRTLELMKWLGVSFPRWLENELRSSSDTLQRSLELCERVFEDVLDYALQKRMPIGINVESISIRKAEIDASVELYQRLRARLSAASALISA